MMQSGGHRSAGPTDSSAESVDRSGDTREYEQQLRKRTEQLVNDEVDEAVAALAATDDGLSPTQQRVTQVVADRIAAGAIAPALDGLSADDATVRDHTATAFALTEDTE